MIGPGQIETLGKHRPTVRTVQIVDSSPGFWATGELREIRRTILEQLDLLTDCDASAIWLLADDTLHLTASCGLPEAATADSPAINLKKHPGLQRLIRDGQPIVIQDAALAGPFARMTRFDNLRACIAAPMVYQSRAIGVLSMLKKEPGSYARKDARSAMALATQAAMLIEKARLYDETHRRALQLEAAGQVSQKVNSILEIDGLFSEVVRLIQEQFGYDSVNLFQVDGRSNVIVLRECSGHAGESLKNRGLRLKIGVDGITGWVAHTGRPLLCNDVSREPRYHPHELLPETQAELAVPLRVGDVVVGVLDVQSTQLHAFHVEDVTALQILADQVAIAIENANLFQRIRRQYEIMQALHEISLDITSQLERERGLEAILHQAAHLLQAQSSTLGIYDRQAKVVRKVAIYNVPPEVRGIELRLGEGVAGQVVATGAPLIVNDYRAWPGRSLRVPEGLLTAVMGVPLRWQGQVIGVLNVLDQGDRRPFTEDDVQVLSLFADLASIALKNAELYTQVREASEQLEQKVERRTKELARAREELVQKAKELQRLLRITVQVQEEERTRIARDLHDGSNQLITATLYEIQAAQESLLGGRREGALEKLETAKELLRKIEYENRRIISGLRPSALDLQGLVPALRWLANTFQEQYPITCSLRVSGSPLRLSPDAETATYRIVQESLNNVAAHAQAQRIQIQVDFEPARLQVVVEDDGVGFDEESALRSPSGQMGLIGMRERAQSIGGHLKIQSVPGQGSLVTLTLPLQNAAALEAGDG